jgi:hypothetical protein
VGRRPRRRNGGLVTASLLRAATAAFGLLVVPSAIR